MDKIIPVVLCGGSGTRLWPRSRKVMPKPFLPLVGDSTLFEATVLRCPAEAGFGAPIVVTGAAHLGHVEAQLPDPARSMVIVEPEGKNTAAAIALAALRLPADAAILASPPDPPILPLPAFPTPPRHPAPTRPARRSGPLPARSPAPPTSCRTRRGSPGSRAGLGQRPRRGSSPP